MTQEIQPNLVCHLYLWPWKWLLLFVVFVFCYWGGEIPIPMDVKHLSICD